MGRIKIGISMPTYCGMYISGSGIAKDWYGRSVKYIEIDEDLLKEVVLRSAERVREFSEFLEHHANMCSAIDCRYYRIGKTWEFLIKLLRESGIEVEPITLECSEARDIQLDMYAGEILKWVD